MPRSGRQRRGAGEGKNSGNGPPRHDAWGWRRLGPGNSRGFRGASAEGGKSQIQGLNRTAPETVAWTVTGHPLRTVAIDAVGLDDCVPGNRPGDTSVVGAVTRTRPQRRGHESGREGHGDGGAGHPASRRSPAREHRPGLRDAIRWAAIRHGSFTRSRRSEKGVRHSAPEPSEGSSDSPESRRTLSSSSQ